MLVDIYSHIFMMSIAATGLYLLLKLASPLTLKHFTASWHYYTGITMYLFFLIPFYKLVSLAHSSFKQADGSIPGVISTIELNQSAVTNPIVSAITAIPQKVYSITSYLDFLPYIFIAGTVIFIAVVFIQSYNLNRRIFRECRPTTDKQTLEIFSKCRQEMGISRDIPVYNSSYTSTPFLCGLFKPRLVLPDIKLSPGELRCVFLHELTHYRRRDTILKYLMLFINAIQWFNPFAYIARRDIDRMCELSCDEITVKSMNERERRQYCRLTLKTLWNLADNKVKFVSAFSDKRKDAERRINMILKGNNSKRKLGARLLAVTLTLALVLAGSFVVSANDDAPVTFTDGDEEPQVTSTITLAMGQDDPNSPVSIVKGEEDPEILSTATLSEGQNDPGSPVSIIKGEEDSEILSIITLQEGQNSPNSPVSFVTVEKGIGASAGDPKASGSLNPGDSLIFNKLTIGSGNTITLYANWTPTGADLNVGIYVYATSTVYCTPLSGGSGTIAFYISQTGDYAIYVGNPSQSIISYSLHYLVN
jgi:beta-lactamase regulating signal transducer with metallopeptidase domain